MELFNEIFLYGLACRISVDDSLPAMDLWRDSVSANARDIVYSIRAKVTRFK